MRNALSVAPFSPLPFPHMLFRSSSPHFGGLQPDFSLSSPFLDTARGLLEAMFAVITCAFRDPGTRMEHTVDSNNLLTLKDSILRLVLVFGRFSSPDFIIFSLLRLSILVSKNVGSQIGGSPASESSDNSCAFCHTAPCLYPSLVVCSASYSAAHHLIHPRPPPTADYLHSTLLRVELPQVTSIAVAACLESLALQLEGVQTEGFSGRQSAANEIVNPSLPSVLVGPPLSLWLSCSVFLPGGIARVSPPNGASLTSVLLFP